MRLQVGLFVIALALTGCTAHERNEANREAVEAREEVKQEAKEAGDAIRDGSAARKVGRGAYEVVDETKEAAAKAGRALQKAAGEAKEGWKEASKTDAVDGK